MNGHIDYLDYKIRPDQMQLVPILVGIPLLIIYKICLNPLMVMASVHKPLQKLTLTGLLSVIAFVLTALLQFKIKGNPTEMVPGQGHLNIYSGFDCNVFVQLKSLQVQVHIDPLEMINVSHTVVSREDVVNITFGFESECSFEPDNYEFDTTVTMIQGEDISYYLVHLNPNTTALNRIGIPDSLVKKKFGNPNLRILIDNTFDFDDNITLTSANQYSLTSYSLSMFLGMNFKDIDVGSEYPIFPYYNTNDNNK